MASVASKTAATAAYYDNSAISKFYEICWGGSDIHIGLYETGSETIAQASTAMTGYLLERLDIHSGMRVLDIACGFGGTLRTLARMGCQVSGIDISQACVEHARGANADAGLDGLITVTLGDFHAIDSAADRWDRVICQESLIHSSNRPQVFAEVYRVLRPGGLFGFSDIITAQNADIAMVEDAFSRLGAAAGATALDYQDMARSAGFELVHEEERLDDIRMHYDKLAEMLLIPNAALDEKAVAGISASISRWRAALAGGHITWACMVARKPV